MPLNLYYLCWASFTDNLKQYHEMGIVSEKDAHIQVSNNDRYGAYQVGYTWS